MYVYVYVCVCVCIYTRILHNIEMLLMGSIYLFIADKVCCRKIYHFRRIDFRGPFLSISFNRFFSNNSFDL